MASVIALLLVAVSLGLSNFAAAIGIGFAGIDAGARIRVGIVFGIFEAGMPILGLVLGRSLAGPLGHAAHWAGGGLLIATGGYALIRAARDGAAPPGRASSGTGQDRQRTGRLIVTGLGLSIDNLAVGFALGAYRVGLALAAAVIGAVSVAMTLAGLELGARIGARAGQRGELFGAVILIAVGIAVAAGAL